MSSSGGRRKTKVHEKTGFLLLHFTCLPTLIIGQGFQSYVLVIGAYDEVPEWSSVR
jgi:hypothetical protein